MSIGRTLRISAIAFGVFYLVGLVMLGDLLGSTADSTSAFTEQFDDTATRIGHILGALAFSLSAVVMIVFGIAFRSLIVQKKVELRLDVLAALAILSAAGLLVASGLIAAPSLVRSIGEMTGDPGIAANASAGIAQAGTVVFFFNLLVLGITTGLTSSVGVRSQVIAKPLHIFGLIAALLTIAGFSVIAAFPLGLYWLAIGVWMRPSEAS